MCEKCKLTFRTKEKAEECEKGHRDTKTVVPYRYGLPDLRGYPRTVKVTFESGIELEYDLSDSEEQIIRLENLAGFKK